MFRSCCRREVVPFELSRSQSAMWRRPPVGLQRSHGKVSRGLVRNNPKQTSGHRTVCSTTQSDPGDLLKNSHWILKLRTRGCPEVRSERPPSSGTRRSPTRRCPEVRVQRPCSSRTRKCPEVRLEGQRFGHALHVDGSRVPERWHRDARTSRSKTRVWAGGWPSSLGTRTPLVPSAVRSFHRGDEVGGSKRQPRLARGNHGQGVQRSD